MASNVFAEIATAAAVESKLYLEFAADYQRELDGLRRYPDLDAETTKHNLRSYSKECDECRRRLGELATRVMAFMPDVAMQTPLLTRLIPHWHTMPDFDWRELARQLRLVEVDAVGRANGKGPKQEQRPPAGKGGRPTNKLLAAALDLLAATPSMTAADAAKRVNRGERDRAKHVTAAKVRSAKARMGRTKLPAPKKRGKKTRG